MLSFVQLSETMQYKRALLKLSGEALMGQTIWN